MTDYCTNPENLYTVFSDLLVAISTPTYDKLMQIIQIKQERAIQELIAEELRAIPKTLLVVDGVILPKCVNFFASFEVSKLHRDHLYKALSVSHYFHNLLYGYIQSI